MTATIAIKPKSRAEQFTELLENSMSAREFGDLHLTLGHGGKHRLTRLLNPLQDNLGDFRADEVIVFARLLKLSPQELVFQWGLGKNNITLQQATDMVQDEGLEIGLVQHAA